MKIRIVAVILSFAVSVVFAGIGLCQDKSQSNQPAKKTGILERIKQGYGNFNKQKKETPVAQKVEAPVVQKTATPAAAEAAKLKNVPPKPAGVISMSKEELLADIADTLESEDEVLDMTPGLKAEKNAKGNIFYTYNGTKIEDLSKEQLDSLAIKVRQARTRLNTERIQRQLETIQRVERLRAIATPRTPSAPASVAQPPQTPRAPAGPPQAPKVSSAPPQPPRR